MMGTGNYILDKNGEPKAVDVLTWADDFETADRKVAVDMIGDLRVSTVFLGLDHNFDDKGPPVLWETMVFGLPEDTDEIQLRYSSRADALKGHKRTCDEIRMAIRGKEVEFGEALSVVRSTDAVRKCCARIQRRLEQ